MHIIHLLCNICILTFLKVSFSNHISTCVFIKRKNVPKINACYITNFDNFSISILNSNSTILEDLRVTNIFDIKAINDRNDRCYYENECDIVLNSLYPMFFEKYYKFSNNNEPLINFAVTKDPALLNIWYNSVTFRNWMNYHNLSKYLSKPVNINHPSFPIILINNTDYKINKVVINSMTQLIPIRQLLFEQILGNNGFKQYSIEHMQLYEGVVYGSAFNGDLLSISCQLKMINTESYQIEKIKLSNNTNTNNNTIELIIPEEKFFSCGYDITKIIQTIIKLGGYTGAFCVKFNLNYHLNFIINEFSPYLCNRLTYDSSLFISSYVPLSFKMLRNYLQNESIRNMKHSHPLLSGYYLNGWYNNIILQNIVKKEYLTVQTGIIQRKKSITDLIKDENTLNHKKSKSELYLQHNAKQKHTYSKNNIHNHKKDKEYIKMLK